MTRSFQGQNLVKVIERSQNDKFVFKKVTKWSILYADKWFAMHPPQRHLCR